MTTEEKIQRYCVKINKVGVHCLDRGLEHFLLNYCIFPFVCNFKVAVLEKWRRRERLREKAAGHHFRK